jgi:hypothetical protein
VLQRWRLAAAAALGDLLPLAVAVGLVESRCFMPDDERVSLIELLSQSWDYEKRRRLQFANATVQDAARLALKDWKPPPMLLTAEEANRAYVLPPPFGPFTNNTLLFHDAPEELTAEARRRYRSYARQAKKSYELVACGELQIVESWDYRKREPDLTPLQSPLWRRIHELYLEARRALAQKALDADQHDPRVGAVWEQIVGRVIESAQMPGIDAEALEVFLESRAWIRRSTRLSAAIAQLDATGFAEQLLTELRRDFPMVFKQPTPLWKSPNDARDNWLYEQCMAGIDYQRILGELKRNKSGWGHLGSVQSLKAAVKRFCDRNPHLPKPPNRDPGRPKQK